MRVTIRMTSQKFHAGEQSLQSQRDWSWHRKIVYARVSSAQCIFAQKFVQPNMGSYLSKPNVEKSSSNEHFSHMSYGASSMQGWRETQEDAHNCIAEFDENTAFFAVYDGHGGPNVAQYCATHLPDFILTLESYKSGNIAQALEDGFLGFDEVVAKQVTAAECKNMFGDDCEIDPTSDLEDEELKMLYEEAHKPIESLMEGYRDKRCVAVKNIKESEAHPQSPLLRAKKSATAKDANNSESKDETSTDIESHLVNGESGKEDENKDTEKAAGSTSSCTEPVEQEQKTDKVSPESTSEEGPCPKVEKNTKSAEKVMQDDGAEPGCSSFDKPGSSKSKESTRKAKVTTVSQEGSGSEDSDDEDENYEADMVAESDSDSEDDEDQDDDDEEDDTEEESSEDNDDDDKTKEPEIENEDIDSRKPSDHCGCTAVVAILRGCELYVANAGDSRCVVSRKGQAIEMSVDHKPDDELEWKRIVNAGGRVVGGRVNNNLNLSRAIGDHHFKKNGDIPARDQMISALPDIRTLTIDPEEDEFLILACDGIWNYMSSQEVVDFVRKRLTDDMEEISLVCEELFDHCLAPNTLGDGTGCDNMTAIVVKFHPTLGQHVATSQRTHKFQKSSEEERSEVKRAKLDDDSQQTNSD